MTFFRSDEDEDRIRQGMERRAATVPAGRLGDPDEVGNLVAFLASERAAYITGAVYQIDGGKLRSNV